MDMTANDDRPRVSISAARATASGVEIAGWCRGREPDDFIEVRVNGAPGGKAKLIARPDLAKYDWMTDPTPGFRFEGAPIDAPGDVWLEARIRRGEDVIATTAVKADREQAPPPPGARASLVASLHPAPPPGALRALARRMTPDGRRRLLRSRAFRSLWLASPDGAAAQLRAEIVLAMIEGGEADGPLDIRLRSGHLVRADPKEDPVIARRFLLEATYEQGLIDALSRLVQPGETVFDVGSCYGHVALACSRAVGRDGHVVAVEPNPVMADRLRQTIARNGHPPVSVVQAALSDAPGETLFKIASSNVGGSRLGIDGVTGTDEEIGALMRDLTVVSLRPDDLGKSRPAERTARFESVTVEVKTLDQLVEAHGLPSLVKMDIEGAELLCLRGATRLLGGAFGPPPIITMEYSDLFPTFGGRREDAFEILADAGYTARRMKHGKTHGGEMVDVPSVDAAPPHDDLFFFPPNTVPSRTS